MRKNFLLRTIILMLTFSLILAGCEVNITSGDKNTPSGTSPGTMHLPDPKNLTPALRAVPTASGTASSPKVLDSYKDETKNYYLIDVGYVKDMFVSKIIRATYNGMSPMTVSKTTINGTTITDALTETIAESIEVSNTQTGKVGIEGAWEKEFPVGKFSAKINVEWTGSWTNSKTSSKSIETSVSKTKSYEEMVTTSVTIGEHGEPAGTYQYAVYAVCDVYFIISTSLDNQILISWDTVVCARDSTLREHWDYSPDGTLENSPDGNAITFADDFYKNLPKPVSTKPDVSTGDPNPTTIGTDFKTIRTSTIKVTSAYIFDNPVDTVNFDVFGFNLNQLKQNGYKTVSFYLQLNVREIKDGNQYLFLYSSKKNSQEYLLSQLYFEHSPGKEDTKWWVHYENALKFENIPIDKFVSNEFIIGYNADKYKGNGYGLDWENKDLKIQLVIKK